MGQNGKKHITLSQVSQAAIYVCIIIELETISIYPNTDPETILWDY